MKKSMLIAFGMFMPYLSITSDHIQIKQKTRNKKAYAKFVFGIAVTAAAIGCGIGGLGVAIGSKDCYRDGNYARALGNVVFGPILVALSIPIGETGFTLLKNGIIGLWKNEQEEDSNKEKQYIKGKA